MDHLCYLCLVIVMLSHLFIAALWSPKRERAAADLRLVLVCDVYCDFVTFPFGILGQVWYLIVSIPDPCCLSYSDFIRHFFFACKIDFSRFHKGYLVSPMRV